jgi:putative transposase
VKKQCFGLQNHADSWRKNAMLLTYKYRLKDGGSSTRRALRAQARAVNYVWNYCCQIDREAYSRYRAGMAVKRPTGFDLIKLVTGVSRELGLHSDCVSSVCQKFADARQATFPKTPRFRSFKRNLDWVPVTRLVKAATFENGVLTFLKRRYHVWNSRPIPEHGKPKAWSLSADTRGRWYLNIAVELPEVEKRAVEREVGIDLGLKTLATLSDGETIETPAFYRRTETELARLQRFGMKSRARSLAAKVANQRKHFLHVASTRLVADYDRIFVGDVSPSKLSKTRMAKSVHDAGWSALRSMLQYKAIAHGAEVVIVNERWTSQVCSECGSLPSSRPRGITDLGVRRWDCSDCGASHDRDVNAARNILIAGAERRPPAVEIPVL